ncbi:hypothetical protein ACSM79_001632 [Campylobacter coli]
MTNEEVKQHLKKIKSELSSKAVNTVYNLRCSLLLDYANFENSGNYDEEEYLLRHMVSKCLYFIPEKEFDSIIVRIKDNLKEEKRLDLMNSIIIRILNYKKSTKEAKEEKFFIELSSDLITLSYSLGYKIFDYIS